MLKVYKNLKSLTEVNVIFRKLCLSGGINFVYLVLAQTDHVTILCPLFNNDNSQLPKATTYLSSFKSMNFMTILLIGLPLLIITHDPAEA